LPPFVVNSRTHPGVETVTVRQKSADGWDGIECLVRPKGQVLPDHVDEDLPKFVEALKQRGHAIHTITTDVKTSRSRSRRKCSAPPPSSASSATGSASGNTRRLRE
jgi:hypothetical protein